MKLHEYKMSVHPGTGVVGRFPTGVVLLSGAEDDAAADKLIGLFNGPATARGKDLGTRLESLFGQLDLAGIAAFAAVVETDKGLSVFLHGPVEVAADSPNVEFRAWGPGETPLLRYDTPDAMGSLSVYLADNAPNGNGDALDLRAGVVSGNGLVLRRNGAEPTNGTKSLSRNGTRPAPVIEPEPATDAAPATVPAPVIEPPAIQFPAVPVAVTPEPDAPSTALRPTYLTRLLTRLLVTLTLGVGITFALGPALQVGFAPVSVTYTTVFISLALLLGIGLIIWDPVYGLLQRSRTGADWPAALLLAAAVPEAALVYGVQNVAFGDLVVNQTALIVHLAATTVLLALATFGLAFVPFTRRHLFRAGRTGGSSTVDKRAGDAPATSTVTTPNGNGAAPLVWGINCAEGHFNRPDARYCGTCGTAMHGLTREPVQGPRPALGYLVSDDGSAYVIDSDYVIGRNPRADGKVQTGQARALTINGSAQAISEAHADVHIDQWDVTISDRGHASGTYVREPDSTNLIRLAPGQPFALQSGSHVHLGQRNFVFHALNRR